MLTCATVMASPLTPQQALERMSDGSRHAKVSAQRLEQTPVYTAVSTQGTPTAYVFNAKDGKGYRILSADDCAYAVLGYSDSGSIDPQNMPPQLKWWLDESARQIAYYSARGISMDNSRYQADPAKQEIAPLVSTKWNQDAPYNNDCPLMGSTRTYTGCVATSMSQVMNYHKYPEKGKGSISYIWSKNNDQRLTMDFSKYTFDWDNMLDVYQRNAYTDAQGKAVSQLMVAAGHSVQMDYGTEASGTQGSLIAEALINYFDYDKGCHPDWRAVYSYSEWENMVYDNLKNVGPLVFNGHPYNDGGHSFVCDGYDGDGYYHFNWGWGGMSDGYYLLESMNPEAQGIGGASAGAGFVYNLNGIFGIQKPNDDPKPEIKDNILMYGGCTATVSNGNINFKRNTWYPDGWYCYAGHNVELASGGIFEPVDGTPGETVYQVGYFGGSIRISLSPGAYYPTTSGPRVKIPNLANGRYKVTIGVRPMSDPKAPFYPIKTSYGCPNYVYLTVQDGSYTIENVDVAKLNVLNMELKSPLYQSKAAKFQVELENNSEFEVTETMGAALLIDGKIKMKGSFMPESVAPKSKGTCDVAITFIRANGFASITKDTEFTLALIDPLTDQILKEFGKVTMKKTPLSLMLVCDDMVIDDCTTVSETINDREFTLYPVPTPDFTVTAEYYVYQGFFDGVLSFGIYTLNPENLKEEMPVMEGIYKEQPFLDYMERATVKVPVSFPQAEASRLYILRGNYTSGKNSRLLKQIYFKVASSGVESVEINADETVKFYNLQGNKITTPRKGEVVIMKVGSKTMKVIF